MKSTHLFVASLASFALVGTAFAQPADPASEPPAGDPPAGGDPAAAPTPTPTPEAAAATGRWPEAIIDRPLTLPKGLLVVGADIVNFTNSFFDPALIRVLAGYGITDDLELGFGHYAFPTSDVGKGTLAVNLGYNLARGAAGGKLDAAARVQTGYSLGAEDLIPLDLGVQVRYKISSKLAVGTSGEQLSFGLAKPNPISLALPVYVAYQAMPKLYVELDTTLAHFKIKDSATTFIFADSTPIAITATYGVMPALEVTAGLSLDLTPPDIFEPISMTTTSGSVGDTLAILVGARYYIGKL